MKKIKCGAKGCEFVERWSTLKPRGPQYVEVRDDFPEEAKAFCSFECAVYAGYMTMNKKSFKEKGGIEVGGSWWVKDPSGGTDERFKELRGKE